MLKVRSRIVKNNTGARYMKLHQNIYNKIMGPYALYTLEGLFCKRVHTFLQIWGRFLQTLSFIEPQAKF
jgi:hypothetical protein